MSLGLELIKAGGEPGDTLLPDVCYMEEVEDVSLR